MFGFVDLLPIVSRGRKGDHHTSTGRAVWQALRVERTASVRFNDPEIVAAWLKEWSADGSTPSRRPGTGTRDRVSRTPRACCTLGCSSNTGCRCAYTATASNSSLQRRIHTNPTGSTSTERHRVGPARPPDLLSGAVIVGHDDDTVCTGLVLRFENGDLVVGTLGTSGYSQSVRCRQTWPASGLYALRARLISDLLQRGRAVAANWPRPASRTPHRRGPRRHSCRCVVMSAAQPRKSPRRPQPRPGVRRSRSSSGRPRRSLESPCPPDPPNT
jgi:hypothetical protein